MDIEKLKSICEESSQPIGNMDEFPLVKALHKSSIFRSNVGPNHVLELIKEIQTLRAKVASADVLVEALREISRIAHMGGLVYMSEPDALIEIRKLTLPYFNTTESVEETKQALATYDKLSEVKHDAE